MLRKILFVLFSLSIVSACNQLSFYDDDELAAIVKDEEITVGVLRFLYSEDQAREYLDWLITVTLAKQEVAAMNLDITPYLKEADEWFGTLPPADTKDEGGQQMRQFAEAQAKKFNLTPEEYQGKYAKQINENNAYIRAYLAARMDEDMYDEKETTEVFSEAANEVLNNLYEENEAEIEVLIP